MTASLIDSVRGRRVWDSRGRPTVEAEVICRGGGCGRAIAPAGASTGSGEALDRRDGPRRADAPFGGLDVVGAVAAVNGEIAAALAGRDAADQEAVDRRLIDLDGTAQKSRLGGNALIATSMAVAHAAAAASSDPLWRSLGGGDGALLPLPEIQIFGGGAHAGRRVDIQDFMCVAVGAECFAQALDWSAEVYRAAGRLMADAGRLQGVADEGGFWPAFDDNEEALGYLSRAIEAAGLIPGEQMAISLDIAASEFGRDGRYTLAREDRVLDSGELIGMLCGWIERYPIVSIEDPLGEDDAQGLREFTQAVGARVQVIGDDFLVTDAARVRAAAAAGACNAVLVKPNQAGTLTETRAALDASLEAGWGAVVSARSGETEDVTIVHLAVGWGAKQLKVGSFARSERMAKWNEGLRIAEALGSGALAPRSAFPWGR
jgi:enolase